MGRTTKAGLQPERLHRVEHRCGEMAPRSPIPPDRPAPRGPPPPLPHGFKCICCVLSCSQDAPAREHRVLRGGCSSAELVIDSKQQGLGSSQDPSRGLWRPGSTSFVPADPPRCPHSSRSPPGVDSQALHMQVAVPGRGQESRAPCGHEAWSALRRATGSRGLCVQRGDDGGAGAGPGLETCR